MSTKKAYWLAWTYAPERVPGLFREEDLLALSRGEGLVLCQAFGGVMTYGTEWERDWQQELAQILARRAGYEVAGHWSSPRGPAEKT